MTLISNLLPGPPPLVTSPIGDQRHSVTASQTCCGTGLFAPPPGAQRHKQPRRAVPGKHHKEPLSMTTIDDIYAGDYIAADELPDGHQRRVRR